MQVGAHELKGTADVLLRQLEAAERRDDVAEKQAKRYGCLMAACIVFGVISLPVSAAFPPLLLLAAALLVGAVVFGVKRAKEKAFDLDDHKLETALRVLRILRTDIPAQEVVTLKLDFRDYRAGGRLVTKEGGWFSSLKVYDYEHAWFDLDLRLADGNVVSIAVRQEITRKEKSKRKYTKVRERVSSDVLLGVKLREGTAEDVRARLAGAPPGLAVRRLDGQGAHLRVALTGGEALTQKGRFGASTTGTPLGADALLGALLWVYGAVAPPAKAA
jgi:hypothetical protein